MYVSRKIVKIYKIQGTPLLLINGAGSSSDAGVEGSLVTSAVAGAVSGVPSLVTID